MARTSHDGHGGNCVAYAREVTGVDLDGNAATWWPHAQGHYERGQNPAIGAILVFKAYGRMRVGHVAVVSRIVGPREVLVDQANWVRGHVTKAMSVIDASAHNDWTSVKVLEPHSGTHGRENPTYGFIYPRVLPASFGETIVEAQQDSHPDKPVAERRKHRVDRQDNSEVARADAAATEHQLTTRAGFGETIVEPQKDHHHTAPVAERRKHHKDGQEEVETTRADPALPTHHLAASASFGETIVEPQRDSHRATPVAERRKHHKDRHDDSETARADPAAATQSAAVKPPEHRKHKATDAKLAAVLF